MVKASSDDVSPSDKTNKFIRDTKAEDATAPSAENNGADISQSAAEKTAKADPASHYDTSAAAAAKIPPARQPVIPSSQQSGFEVGVKVSSLITRIDIAKYSLFLSSLVLHLCPMTKRHHQAKTKQLFPIFLAREKTKIPSKQSHQSLVICTWSMRKLPLLLLKPIQAGRRSLDKIVLLLILLIVMS